MRDIEQIRTIEKYYFLLYMRDIYCKVFSEILIFFNALLD